MHKNDILSYFIKDPYNYVSGLHVLRGTPSYNLVCNVGKATSKVYWTDNNGKDLDGFLSTNGVGEKISTLTLIPPEEKEYTCSVEDASTDRMVKEQFSIDLFGKLSSNNEFKITGQVWHKVRFLRM